MLVGGELLNNAEVVPANGGCKLGCKFNCVGGWLNGCCCCKFWGGVSLSIDSHWAGTSNGAAFGGSDSFKKYYFHLFFKLFVSLK